MNFSQDKKRNFCIARSMINGMIVRGGQKTTKEGEVCCHHKTFSGQRGTTVSRLKKKSQFYQLA
jgi:hypothetical protein